MFPDSYDLHVFVFLQKMNDVLDVQDSECVYGFACLCDFDMLCYMFTIVEGSVVRLLVVIILA